MKTRRPLILLVPGGGKLNPHGLADVNIQGTIRLLERAWHAAGVGPCPAHTFLRDRRMEEHAPRGSWQEDAVSP